MERIKYYVNRLIHPHWAVAALASLSFPALILLLGKGLDTAWFSYPLYVLAFYALCADCFLLVPALIRLSKQAREKEAQKGPQEKEKALKGSIYQSFFINLLYGAGQTFQGVWVRSAWIGAGGLYNLAHGFAHAILVRYEQKLDKWEDPTLRLLHAWHCYRLCGWALLALNLTMTGIAFQTVWLGRTEEYSEITVIAVAAFTFYKLTVAIIGVFQCRKTDSPILGAARNLSMTEALMSLFNLQSALLAVFGQGFEYTFLFNSLTGGAVCLSTVLGGIGMIFHADQKCKKLSGENNHG